MGSMAVLGCNAEAKMAQIAKNASASRSRKHSVAGFYRNAAN